MASRSSRAGINLVEELRAGINLVAMLNAEERGLRKPLYPPSA
tara:strand:- start:132 stop:260 length:129 start_codon:yes stop_codon:yes gene_type:complete